MNYKSKYFNITTEPYTFSLDCTLIYHKKFVEVSKHNLLESLGGFAIWYVNDLGPTIINLYKGSL
jgi:hypothetical protein